MGRIEQLERVTVPPRLYNAARRGAVAVAALLCISWAVIGTRRAQNIIHGHEMAGRDNSLNTDWNLIEPSEDLHWAPCFRLRDAFFCARLTVPMDYNRPLNQPASLINPNPKVHIALIMLPGRNHTVAGEWSESPLLVNPGGPGGSGTYLVMAAGRAHQQVADPDRDIIGFDPRGIGATTPRADCFADISANTVVDASDQSRPSDQGSFLRRMLWMLQNQAVGLPNTSSTAIDQTVLRARGLTKLCGLQDDQDSILRHAGTPNVAQDMLSIVQAWDKWTSSTHEGPPDLVLPHGSIESVPQSSGTSSDPLPPSTRGRLVYWGFSYGTVLGATFAAMFPEYVGRMVLDGVVDSDEWYFENASPAPPFPQSPEVHSADPIVLLELEGCPPGSG